MIAVSLQAGFEVPRFGDLHGMGRIVAHTQEDVVLSDARGSGCRDRCASDVTIRPSSFVRTNWRASLHRRARESSRSSGSTRRTTATLSTVQTGWVVQSSRRNQTSRGLLADLEPGLAEAAAEPGLAVPELGLDPGLADLQVGLVGPHPVLAMGCPIVRIAVRSFSAAGATTRTRASAYDVASGRFTSILLVLGGTDDTTLGRPERSGPSGSSKGLDAGIADLDLVDRHGHAPAVGQPGRDEATAAVDLETLLFEHGTLMLGDRWRLVPQPVLVDPRTGEDGTRGRLHSFRSGPGRRSRPAARESRGRVQ